MEIHVGMREPSRLLLSISAAIELATGISLEIAPSMGAKSLIGAPLDSPAELAIGRILGAALFTLGLACWLVRKDDRGGSASAVIAAMLVYNLAIVLVLIQARIGPGISGAGFWPAVVFHATMASWCFACLRNSRRDASGELGERADPPSFRSS